MSRNNRFDRNDREDDRNNRNNSRSRDYHEEFRRDNSKKEDNDRWRKGDYYRDRQYGNNRNKSYNKYENDKRMNKREQSIKVFQCQVDPPTQYIISDQSLQFRGELKVNFEEKDIYPNRLDSQRLGELKNMITPIQKIWTSHIKQYLNISQFVEIYRKYKSLAFPPIQYGKSIINYNEGAIDMVYDNSTEQSPIFSRAYFKLWEILELGVLKQHKNKAMKIGCVAEGPGGFIHALIDYRERQHKGEDCPPKDNYNAITLKIDEHTRNAKDWNDPRAKHLFDTMRKFGCKIDLSYGSTGTGDLLKVENIEYFRDQVKGKCELVTGDGGIQCIGDKEFEYQQVFNSKLFLGEILTAFHIQEINGSFILKIYDCGFQLTRQLILLLAAYYQVVRIVKPITSRPGNSERYLLCQQFRGISEKNLTLLKELLVTWTKAEPKISYFQNNKFAHNLFDFSHFPNYEKVYENIKKSNDLFVKEQEEKLEEGLKLAQKYQTAERIEQQLKKTRFQQQTSFAYAWCKKYGLATIKAEIIKKMTQ